MTRSYNKYIRAQIIIKRTFSRNLHLIWIHLNSVVDTQNNIYGEGVHFPPIILRQSNLFSSEELDNVQEKKNLAIYFIFLAWDKCVAL